MKPLLPEHLLKLSSGRSNPFEIFILLLGLVSGIPILSGHVEPTSVAALLDPALLHIWAWMLTAGCGVALTGVLWPRRAHTGFLIEQVGLVAVGAGVVIYVVGLAQLHDPGRVLGIAIASGFGLACWWRVWLIQRWIKSLIFLVSDARSAEAADTDPPGADPPKGMS
jgi:hypothetical protein